MTFTCFKGKNSDEGGKQGARGFTVWEKKREPL